MPARPHVPREFAQVKIATPEQAADYVLDFAGPVAADRIRDSIAWAEREGRSADVTFYRAVLEILLTR